MSMYAQTRVVETDSRLHKFAVFYAPRPEGFSCLCVMQISGTVDQSGSMLMEDVGEKGYALLCVAMPTSDCVIETVSEVRGGPCHAP